MGRAERTSNLAQIRQWLDVGGRPSPARPLRRRQTGTAIGLNPLPMRFLALAVLLALMAFFAAGEFALIRLRPSRVQQLLDDGEPGARAVARLQQRLRDDRWRRKRDGRHGGLYKVRWDI